MASSLEVNAVLTELNLANNNLVKTNYFKASEVEGASKEVGAKVIYQGREMTVSKGVNFGGDLKMIPADLPGVRAIADALKVNAVLTELNVSGNR